jgi:L-threonylcarbamoyladenylate synthase
MSDIFLLDPSRPEAAAEALDAAAVALAEGKLVVLPTETVYGVAARPDLPDATADLFATKQRPRDLNLPVLTPNTQAAWGVAEADQRAEHLAVAFWPGPLTLVLPRSERSREWDLGKRAGSVGVRVPAHPLSAALLERTGALAVTSANLSGQPTPSDPVDVRRVFGDRVAVYLFVPGPGPAGAASERGPAGGVPSTVVDLTRGDFVLVREGAIAAGDLELALLGREGPDTR